MSNNLIIRQHYLKIIFFKKRSGPNKWRDSRKPSEILEDLCKKRSIPFEMPTSENPNLKINNKLFNIANFGKLNF